MFSLKVEGQELASLIKITNVDRGLGPTAENVVATSPLLNGGKHLYRRFESREIEVNFVIMGDIDQKIEQVKRMIYPNRLLKWVFGDQPDRYYLGILDGESEFNKLNGKYAKGSFTILCPDPMAYSTAEKTAFKSLVNKLTFNNLGTAPVYPVFEGAVGSDLKMIAFSHPSGRVLQYGYEQGDVLLRASDRFVLDCVNRVLTVNGQRRYVNSASQFFELDPGTTEIGVSVNSGGQTPSIVGKFREAFL